MRPFTTMPHRRRPSRRRYDALADLLVCSRGERYVEPLRHHAYGQPRRGYSQFHPLEGSMP